MQNKRTMHYLTNKVTATRFSRLVSITMVIMNRSFWCVRDMHLEICKLFHIFFKAKRRRYQIRKIIYVVVKSLNMILFVKRHISQDTFLVKTNKQIVFYPGAIQYQNCKSKTTSVFYKILLIYLAWLKEFGQKKNIYNRFYNTRIVSYVTTDKITKAKNVSDLQNIVIFSPI